MKAILSPDRLYRYQLERVTVSGGRDVGRLCWIMLNPSTADEDADDPTIRRCVGFAQRWGYGAIRVVNLFAWRATDPEELREATHPKGDGNDAWIVEAVASSALTIAAWGAAADRWDFVRDRARFVAEMLSEQGTDVMCLGRTKGGAPRHPLMLPYSAKLEPYAARLPRETREP